MFCINIKCIVLSIINNNNIIYSTKIVLPIEKKSKKKIDLILNKQKKHKMYFKYI